MQKLTPYNPLDKVNLGKSVADALLERPIGPLPPPEPFIAAGIYVIYYTGDFAPYVQIAKPNRHGEYVMPIYIGKAVPAGARRGGIGAGDSPGTVLFSRLNEHAESVRAAQNLDSKHFFCRFLAVDDIWIPLGESLLIKRYAPIWNVIIDGFGNHDPGGGRYNQQCSPWDMLHPGRVWARKCKQNVRTKEQILGKLADVLAGRDKPDIVEM